MTARDPFSLLGRAVAAFVLAVAAATAALLVADEVERHRFRRSLRLARQRAAVAAIPEPGRSYGSARRWGR